MRRRRFLTRPPRPSRTAGAAFATLLLAAVGAAGCGPESADADPGADGHAHHEAPAPLALPGGSLYHLDGEWTDRTGERLRLRDLAGEVRVVALVYTSCSSACPAILADMKRLEGSLGPGESERVGFVIVSIDPERDTPERLARFAASTGLDPQRWTLLHGSDGQILEVAAVLGVQYRRVTDTDFSHSNVVTVLDRGGEPVHRRTAIGTDLSPALEAVRGALRN